ncbi:patatin-like phospholipase family protein [Photobacterium sp. ZSDE20]|uniref:Patatin-like phospholipase family protein n=1 Tax=Photobacterium pectinilyticum TaxID=2906793 RepID=A0ABT1N8Z4_9GAMM|nr:patatin-like phospholipase family protein [Photobacterium sp. ZSDE20]MCQ1059724.1 patatin-like phospholipase family protein [Photobacterium sp. ZSDE20]MDD1825930.1 patatin-like phospholipase family protein [Photobacterium sp. ZSDE20]
MAKKILSICGGGIRGIIPGMMLVSLEEKLQKKSNNPEARIADYFDLVAGTSTGAILGAAYLCPGPNGRPKFTAQEAVDIYLEQGDDIFDVSVWRSLGTLKGLADERYSAKELEKSLHAAFGETKLSELLKPTCFVAYDIFHREQIIFKQHTAIEKNRDFLVRDLLRGGSAAPTYFETARIYSLPPKQQKFVLVDGGMVANDPTLCAFTETIKTDGIEGISDVMILSLGTGKELKRYSYPDMKDLGFLGWAKPSVDIALEGGPQITVHHMKQITSTLPEAKYHWIQPELHGADLALDNASPENLERLRNAGLRNATEHDDKLEEIADFLVNDHRKSQE